MNFDKLICFCLTHACSHCLVTCIYDSVLAFFNLKTCISSTRDRLTGHAGDRKLTCPRVFCTRVTPIIIFNNWPHQLWTECAGPVKDKLKTVSQLDEDILKFTEEEDEIKEEIEQTDIYRERMEQAIVTLEVMIADLERMNAPQPATLRDTTATTQEQVAPVQASSSAANNGVPAIPEGNRPSTSSGSHSVPVQPPSVLPNPPVVPVSAARVPKVKLPKVILKRFDGSLIQWATFWDMFESSIHTNLELSDIDKFNYLHSLLEGSAADSISGLSLTASNYSEAIAILKRRFGNKQQVVNRHMDLLLELEPVFSMRDLKKICHLYDQVEGHVRNLRSLGVSSESYGSLLSPIVMKRLPQELCIIVSKQGSDSWNLDQMMEIIEKELEARERASMNSSGHNTQIQTRKSHDHPTAAVLVATNASFSCYYCGEQHVSTSCKTVTNPDARRQILLKTGRCFICLRKGHMGKDCRSSTRCASCRGRHHTSICGSTRNPQGSTSPVPSSSSSQLQQGTPLTAKTGTSSVSLYVDMRTPVLSRQLLRWHTRGKGQPDHRKLD